MIKSIGAVLVWTLVASAAWADNLPPVDVYKSPYCGCCGNWVEHMRAAGFKVRVHDTKNVDQNKAKFGIPYGYGSCHTAEVGGYVIKGHVPADQVKRLLASRSKARGLIVPGMPGTSPGMEGTGNPKDHYDVLLLGQDGKMTSYARY
ncbi:MAG: DUF411 domain-containing protein [Gammaproteobacteria bacterium]|nr:DUF411 domain-containing protein [Gammaproteobacteria bacterium]MBU1414172.1 DUF411 domain-containing protein [Gammaproteobacteria bacterium]